jgi:hypothetical protein
MNEDIIKSYATQEAIEFMPTVRGWLGMVRLRQELSNHLPSKIKILDIGGGNGIVSGWLLSKGHQVYLLDLMPELVSEAKKELSHYSGFQAGVGDARNLPFSDSTFDAVISLGPHYHLLKEEDRLTSLLEIRRTVKPGGKVIVEFMGRYNFDLWAAHRGLTDDEALLSIQNINSAGNMINAGSSKNLFMTCHTDTSKQMLEIAQKAGLINIENIALEGPFWPASTPSKPLDRKQASRLLSIARRNSTLEEYINLSPHSLLVAQRPD